MWNWRQAEGVMGLPDPPGAFHGLARQEMGPDSFREVNVDLAVGPEHRGHEQRVAQEVLFVEGLAH